MTTLKTEYTVWDSDGGDPGTYQATSATDAAEQYVASVDWGNESTIWIHCIVTDANGNETREIVDLDPPEPRCNRTHEHDWHSHTGPYGHGGGVTYSDRCIHCGVVMHVDTWATDEHGNQGLRSIRYDRPT